MTADDLHRALEAVNGLRRKDRRDLTARSFCMFQVFEGEVDNLANKIAAMDFRFEALARLSDRREFKGWSIPPDHLGKMVISDTVLRAAAVEPLLIEDERPTFNPESFFKRLLAMSQSVGSG